MRDILAWCFTKIWVYAGAELMDFVYKPELPL